MDIIICILDGAWKVGLIILISVAIASMFVFPIILAEESNNRWWYTVWAVPFLLIAFAIGCSDKEFCDKCFPQTQIEQGTQDGREAQN